VMPTELDDGQHAGRRRPAPQVVDGPTNIITNRGVRMVEVSFV
jgi:hypothetical protein